MESSSRRSGVVRLLAVSLTVALGSSCLVAGSAAAAPTPAPTGTATESVIVIMANQLTSTPPTRAHIAARRSQANGDQDAVLTRLSKRGGRRASSVVHYSAANAVSLTVTPAQAATLAADPAVAVVVPNVRVSLPAPSTSGSASTAVAPHALPVPANTSICPTDPAKPLLEPEALADTNTASDDPTAKTAQKLVDGTGVKVAFIADGINPDSPDFIRADGSHVITDYKAFSSDGPAPTVGGAEAYGDASSIAAQGRVSHDLSTFVNPAYPLPTGCNIRILGMSPGASIVALKTDFYTTSIVQAIDYAVSNDHVDVLNESFGGNVIPDAAARNAISLFNDMAVAAGTTVTVSSGDAGTTSTIGNPATDPNVISVAANTNNRGYAQTGYAGARFFGNGKWDNDEISSLSSGGFTQSGGTVDLTAPGEAGWAVCDKDSTECVNYHGTGSDFQLFGGTSQSAPLTAGAAALVIHAYRSTHGGASPAPGLVKKLLTSTATDLGLPTFEQGAGLLDARAAVEAALTYPGATKSAPAGVGSNIVLSTSQLSISGAPGSSHTSTVAVRNVGTRQLTVAASTRDYLATSVKTQTTALDASSNQTFPYPVTGAPWVYKKITFTVPFGTDRLVAAMIWQGAAKQVGAATVTPVVRLTVLDPSGTFVTNSRPQGGPVSANYANLDIRRPVAGTYTAVLYTPAGASGYTGNVSLQTTAQQAVPVGQVSPSVLTLAPGQVKNVRVTLKVPTTGGDTSQAITFGSSDGHQTAVAVVLRSVVPVSAGVGTFGGTITGGNGRAGSAAQSFTYAFDVPTGRKAISVGLKLANDPGVQLEGVLVDPHDETQAIDSNAITNGFDTIASQGLNLQLNTANPVPGRWRVIILVVNPVTGTAFGQKFTGKIAFDTSKVTAAGLPHSKYVELAKGRPVKVEVRVTNTGIAPINVQVDPRTDKLVDIPLAAPLGSQSFDLPDHAVTAFIVPPGTTSLTAAAVSSLPALVELFSGAQGIDVVGDLKDGQNGSTISVARVTEKTGTVSTGIWYTDVNEIGAVGAAGAPAGTSSVDLSAHTPDFDSAITSSTGDFYDAVTDPSADIGTPLTIAPGATGTVTVTITPNAAKGTVVNGVLNIVTPPSIAYPTFNSTGDVITQVPYTYTVGPPIS